ncbi:gastrokine-1-like [Podarcis muralis]
MDFLGRLSRGWIAICQGFWSCDSCIAEAVLVFLVSLTYSSASDVIAVKHQGNTDTSTHQAVKVNQQDQTANIHNYNGWNGWDAVWDYQKGLFAARLFRKRVCVVAAMDFELFPSLETLHSFKGQKLSESTLPPSDLTFLVGKTRVQNTVQFGSPIEQLCSGIPVYYASKEQGANLPLQSRGCANVGILRGLFNIYLCGNIPSC